MSHMKFEYLLVLSSWLLDMVVSKEMVSSATIIDLHGWSTITMSGLLVVGRMEGNSVAT